MDDEDYEEVEGDDESESEESGDKSEGKKKKKKAGLRDRKATNKIVNGYEPGHARPWMAMLQVRKSKKNKIWITVFFPTSLAGRIWRRPVRRQPDQSLVRADGLSLLLLRQPAGELSL